MIRYSLTCDRDHAFESWFQSADAFDALLGGGRLSCPECGSAKVSKGLMAPSVRTARGEAERLAAAGEREKALAELRRRIEENSEYVGMGFAAEARRIHDGEAPERSIYGEARPDEARALIEDGVPVAPLPFLPVRKTN
jgi:hypothetical protein